MKKKVLVIGEKCDDIFLYGKCNRLNPEAPTPVLTPTNSIVNPGMGGNVVENFKHIGIDCDFMTNTEIITKTRYVDETSNYILLRVDLEPEIEPLTEINTLDLKDYDAIVISDYNKGLLTKKFLERVFMISKSINIPTFMDTKKDIGEWATNCGFIKINEKEYNNPKHKEFLERGILKDNLIITLGGNGCQSNGKHYPTNEINVRDVVGAGDTHLVGLVYGYLKNNEIEEGIIMANKLASDVVKQKGVSLPNKELLK
jgi:D-beta-D-heptose 7-phosphate kinase/D-beta-D-heptose 1-phosphate adenosyltransferase